MTGATFLESNERVNGRLLIALVAVVVVARGWLLFGTPWVPGVNGAYLVAVKCADAVLPALVVVPVWMIVDGWSRAAGAGRFLPLACAAGVGLGAPALAVVGDLQKNSLGLVWLAALLASLHAWRESESVGPAIAALVFFGLGGLTHVGVFGTMLVVVPAFVGLSLIARSGSAWRVPWPWPVVAVAVALLAGLVLWRVDPHRAERLAGALLQPATFLQGRGPGGAAPPGPPGLPGPPGFALLRWGPCILGCGAGLIALVLVWRRRVTMPPGQTTLAGACAVTVVALTGPWVSGDVTIRFALIAVVPWVVTLAFLVLSLPGQGLRRISAWALLLLVVAPSVPLVARGGHPIVTDAALSELGSLAAYVEEDRSLVVARHGLEWWTAWSLRTHIAQPSAERAADWSRYRQVFFLRQKGGSDTSLPVGLGPPPSEDPAVPRDALVVHDGPFFTLALVGSPAGGKEP